MEKERTFVTIEGDLIDMAIANQFGVIAHGCNCFNTQGKGIARQMAKAFGTDNYELEGPHWYGDINKLGQIEGRTMKEYGDPFIVVNCYTQYHYISPGAYGIPLDYDALILCMRKINIEYADCDLGLPLIGCGNAKGDWHRVETILRRELTNCNVTIVNFKP